MSHFRPRSSAPSTVSNRASSPAAWPSVRFRPRRVAHRPLPSITQATCAGMRSGSMSAGSTTADATWGRVGDRWVRSDAWSTSARCKDRLASAVGWLDGALSVHERFGAIGGGPLSSSIALATFLSLFPLLLVLIAVVGFLSAGQRRLHQRRDQRARARRARPPRWWRTPSSSPRAASRRRRSSAWSVCSGPGWRWSAPCRPPSTPRGRSLGPRPARPRSSRCAWLLGAGSLFLVTAALGPALSWLPGVAGARQHRSSASSSPPCSSAGPTRPSATTRSAGGSTCRARSLVAARLRDPQGRRRRVPAPPHRRVLGALRLDRRGVRHARLAGDLRAPHRATAPRSTSCGTRPPPAPSPSRSRCPRIDGEVPLTATRGGAVDERGRRSDRTSHRRRPFGTFSVRCHALVRFCADILVQGTGPSADVTMTEMVLGGTRPCGHEHLHQLEWWRPRPRRSPGSGRSAPGRPGGPAAASAPTPTPSTAPPASAPA